MALTPATFIQARPEFESAGVALVAQALAIAAAELDSATWGSSYDRAVSAAAAHWLWSSPFGASMRRDGDGNQLISSYEAELETIRLARVPRIITL